MTGPEIRIGDEVLDADGQPWRVLNAPCAIEGAESDGLYRHDVPGGGQQYGQHMRGPLVVWSDR